MPLNELSDKDIERGLWYIRNKAKIKKIIIISLCVLIFGFFAYSIPKFIMIKIQDAKDKNQTWASVNFNSTVKAADINVLEKSVISTGSDTYDLVISVQNPNKEFILRKISYDFVYNGEKSLEMSDYILPGQTKRLVLKDVKSENIIEDFDFEILNISFKKLKKSELDFAPREDVYSISNPKLNFSNSDVSNRTWVTFDVKNTSPYNFKTTNFYILVYSGTRLSAIEKLKVENFYSKEDRKLEVGWFYKIPSYANLVIEEDTDIFDKTNYISNK